MYTDHINTKKTSQLKVIPGRKTDMKKNNAGGFVFQVSKWDQLTRFLILGSDGGSYYASAKKLTQDNAKVVIECIKEDGIRVLQTTLNISETGRAPKNEPAIFVLALVCTYGNEQTKQVAYSLIHKICRTGTHLFHFCQMIQDLRGWSRGLRRGVGEFYLSKRPDFLAYQAIKYRQRDGWTHRDVLRLAHPKSKDDLVNSTFAWMTGKSTQMKSFPSIIGGFEEIQSCRVGDEKIAAKLIQNYRLPREAVPTELLKSKEVWEALLVDMPMTALIRNLGVMSSVGLIDTVFSDSTKLVLSKMSEEAIKKSKVHPIQILQAMKVYSQGHGEKGKLSWKPLGRIVDHLDEAFYQAFSNVESTNKNTMVALDVSGSMSSSAISGMSLTAREVSCAMAMINLRTEPNCELTAFSDGFIRLNLSKKTRLNEMIRALSDLPFSSTDCSIPMRSALKHRWPIETFIIYTDNETWSGSIHPKEALDQYREQMGINAKLAVCATSATEFTIADPNDKGMLDIVGFDTATPEIIRAFSVGGIEEHRNLS